MQIDTYFAPSKKAGEDEFREQVHAISNSPIMDAILQVSSGLLLIFNETRQVVAANHGLAERLGIKDIETVLGLRIGDIMTCVNAEKGPNGCGTTPNCVSCGAAIATMACINDDVTSEQICLLSQQEGKIEEDLALSVKAQSIVIENQRWILFFARDITQENFWINLEHVFFHDISNLLVSLLGNSELLGLETSEDQRARHMHKSILKLCNEVAFQQTLSQTRDSVFPIELKTVSIKEIRDELQLFIGGHRASKNRSIQEIWPSDSITVKTDLLLISRVLGNMVINALEATTEKDEVNIIVKKQSDHISWDICNPGHIPEELKPRIFQRYFSTKSKAGRGLGTYSMKLFGERYLKGKVSFTSHEETGTTFSLILPFKD